MFIPHKEFNAYDMVTNLQEIVTEDGVFTAGHLFTVKRITCDNQCVLVDDDGRIVDAYPNILKKLTKNQVREKRHPEEFQGPR